MEYKTAHRNLITNHDEKITNSFWRNRNGSPAPCMGTRRSNGQTGSGADPGNTRGGVYDYYDGHEEPGGKGISEISQRGRNLCLQHGPQTRFGPFEPYW